MKQSQPEQALKIIISGGGTGGHIFPAVAIVNAIKVLNPNAEFLFIGAKGRMEMEKVPAAGYKIEGLWISGLQRKILSFANMLFPLKVLSSVMKARAIIRKFKPNVAVGTGGYASGPMLWAATRKNIPTLIQEQNSYAGITNKILAKRVSKICVAYEDMEKFFPKDKIVITGNPVRQDIQAPLDEKRENAFDFFKLDKTKKTLLVIGGSLGARTINESIAQSLEALSKHNIQLVWQTGKAFYSTAQELEKKYRDAGIRVYDFIYKMDFAYAVADMVVSRAGAISISELCITGKPCILIPSPNVAEDHQTKNALTLVSMNAALMIKDSEARTGLTQEIMNLAGNTILQQTLRENIQKLAYKDSALAIAKEVLHLAESKK